MGAGQRAIALYSRYWSLKNRKTPYMTRSTIISHVALVPIKSDPTFREAKHRVNLKMLPTDYHSSKGTPSFQKPLNPKPTYWTVKGSDRGQSQACGSLLPQS